MKFRELPATIIGELGEAAGADLMRQDGASMIALCRIDTGGAPMLERGKANGPTKNLVLPDFQAFNWRGKSACFVEIKTYAESREFRKFSLMIHGIPVRLFEHYRNVEKETGLPVFLGINELDSGELRISATSITALQTFPCLCKGGCRSDDANRHVSSGRGIREMQWYFDRDDFSIVYKHSDKTIERLRKEHSKRIGGHAWSRHAAPGAIPADPLITPGTPSPCRHCGKLEDAGTVFVVGELSNDKDRYVLCGTCWHAGITPNQSQRMRSAGWRP